MTRAYGKTRRRARRVAMTLSEVVTTVCSVSVLIALVLPSMSEVRRQGKEVVCLRNLSRLGAASAIHANADPGEQPIPTHPLMGLVFGALGEYEWGGKAGMGEPQAGQEPTTSKWGTLEGRGPATRGLNRIIYGDVFPDYQDDRGPNELHWKRDMELELDVFRCPSDRGYAGHHYAHWRNSRLSSYDHYGTSYSASALWIRESGGPCLIWSLSPHLRPASRVPNSATTVLFLENCGRFGYRANYGGPNDGGCSPHSGVLGNDQEKVITGWHSRPWMFQVAYHDGHAGIVKMQGHQQPEPTLGRYPRWNGQSTDHDFWRCVIIRGPGWQLDTLPAPPVRTNFGCAQSGAVVNGIG